MKRAPLSLYAVSVVALAVILGVAFTGKPHKKPDRPALGFRSSPLEADMQDWKLADLRDALAARGLELRLLPESPGLPIYDDAFLALPERASLNRPLVMNRAKSDAGDWRGVVHFRRTRDDAHDCLIRQEPEHTLKIGVFLFFGDPDLLARIAHALDAR